MSFEKFSAEIKNKEKELCYPKRINAVKKLGRETEHIENGIADVVRVLEKKIKSFVVYGEPQSGKTEFMIALACKLIDMNYQTIFVVMNDNTELESQNFDRFHGAPELNPIPMRDKQIPSMSPTQLKQHKKRIIFCRKNSKNLQKLIDLCRHMENRVIIDDEADYASPNARINKKEVTAINKFLGQLGHIYKKNGDLLEQDKRGTYIGVTATPARLDLNNTFLNESRDWVFLNSHSNYKGRNFFFPTTEEEINKSDYILKQLPEDGDDPKLLRHAVFRFLGRVAILNMQKDAEQTAYSMLIHTGGTTNDHEKDQQDVQNIIRILSDENEKKFEQYIKELMKICSKLIDFYNVPYLDYEIAKFIFENIGRSEVLVINHKNDGGNVQRAGVPKALFTFAIGGNIVSRGLTFERLLTFFFSRNVKNSVQQNTYIQRARMFGARPKSNYFELCVPKNLFSDWANCFHDHELSLQLGRAGAYQHIQSGRTSVVDSGAIDKENVEFGTSERAVGSKFELTEEIENILVNSDQATPIMTIRQLLDTKKITQDHFPSSLLIYLEKIVDQKKNDMFMVLRSENNNRFVQNIGSYKGADQYEIARPRGGIIHAMLNKRKEYTLYNHFILPIKNDYGEARFMYKANLGHKILQNLKVYR